MAKSAFLQEILVQKFDPEAAQKFRKAYTEAAQSNPLKPILVHIDSYGGLVDSLASMVDTIDSFPNPLITYCSGKAMSCGAILLSHGDIRVCGPNSRVMIHEVSGGAVGHVDDVKTDSREIERLNHYFMDLLAKNCGLTGYDELKAKLKELDGRDMYLTPREAVKFGIVDRMGHVKIREKKTYELRFTENGEVEKVLLEDK